MAAQGKVSMVDSTVRLEWEVTKEEFDNCEFNEVISSPVYKVPTGTGDEQSEWVISLYPKGDDEESKDEVQAYLQLDSFIEEDVVFNVKFLIEVKTPTGFWPTDFVKALYDKNAAGVDMSTSIFRMGKSMYGHPLCTTKKFSEMFIQNKITVVATMAIFMEGELYLKHRNIAEEFVRDMRSMPELDMFYDLTVICGDQRLKSNKALLASRSWVFRAMLETDMIEKMKGEIIIKDVKPDIMKDLLDFLSNGLIPDDLDTKAVEMMHVAQKYKLDGLTEACENSLINNLSVVNVINTLINVDLYVPRSEHREKILDFINSKAAEVIETEDWMKFVQNYPKLVTELYKRLALVAIELAADQN